MALLMLGIGIIALLALSRVAVSLGGRFADRYHLSPVVVGLLIVVLGASLPEIGTNVGAGVVSRLGTDASGVAVGNIIGSCLAQVTLILGFVAAAGTVTAPKALLGRDGAMMMAALVGMFLVCADGRAELWEGVLLSAAYFAYVGSLILLSPSLPPATLPLATVEDEAAPDPDASSQDAFRPMPASSLREDLGWMALTLLGLAGAGLLVVQGAATIALASGMSQEFIGIAVGVAGGIPELLLALRGVQRQQGALAIGTLLGSNITDPLLSFGLGAIVHPVTVPATTLWFDFVVWGVLSLVALELLRQDGDLSRRESFMLMVLFGIYLWVRIALL